MGLFITLASCLQHVLLQYYKKNEDEITTEQSKMLDDTLSFLEQCEKYDTK
jgi:hypothetical protein